MYGVLAKTGGFFLKQMLLMAVEYAVIEGSSEATKHLVRHCLNHFGMYYPDGSDYAEDVDEEKGNA